jgi:aconitate hydratase
VTKTLDSFKSRSILKVRGKDYVYYSLAEAEKNGLAGISKLPHSMKVVLENLLRFEDGVTVRREDIYAVAQWLKKS